MFHFQLPNTLNKCQVNYDLRLFRCIGVFYFSHSYLVNCCAHPNTVVKEPNIFILVAVK